MNHFILFQFLKPEVSIQVAIFSECYSIYAFFSVFMTHDKVMQRFMKSY